MTRKSIKTSAQETVVAAGKSAAEGTKTLAGDLAHAAATAAAAPGAVWDKVATAIGAKKSSSRTKKKVAKKVASKKRTTLKKKANTKKASRRSAKKKRL
jgi:long-subunit acyl-CoA synthetase (AMP-forming)